MVTCLVPIELWSRSIFSSYCASWLRFNGLTVPIPDGDDLLQISRSMNVLELVSSVSTHSFQKGTESITLAR